MIALALTHWKMILGGLGVLILGFYIAHLKGEARHWEKESTRFEALYHAEQSAHQLTVAGYRKATAEAQAADAAHVIQVERKQAKVSQEVSHDYQTKLAALRARYDALRVRGQGPSASAHPGSGNETDLAGIPDASARVDGPSGETRLPPEDALIASEQALRLQALQEWVRAQEAVPR